MPWSRPARTPALPPSAADPLPSLLGRDAAALAAVAAAAGEPPGQAALRGRQIFHWLYHRGAVAPTAMTTLPAGLRDRLAAGWTAARPAVVADQLAADGTRKWLLRLADAREVETVFIPEDGRGTVCVSTQVGCSLTCSFCHTGTMPLVRNLAAAEILAQVLVAKDALGDWDPARRRLTNVVVMGMGEPLLNYDSLVAALAIALAPDGLDLSRRRVTVSTSGIVPKIAPLGEALGVGLAVSLHAVRDELRDELVPINRRWPIAELLEACRRYPAGRAITFEYVMLAGVNDSDGEARELVRLLAGIPAKVNLIPFNAWPGAPFVCSSSRRMRAFAAILESAGYESPVRTPRGRDILAACGQLKTASERQRRAAA